MRLSRYGISLLSNAVPTIAEINLWAAENGQQRPLITEPLDNMGRYSVLIPGQLWLHKHYRMIGWGFRFPKALQFKMEYSSGNGAIANVLKTFRMPMW